MSAANISAGPYKTISIERLRECFEYDPETGAIKNRIQRGGHKVGIEIPAIQSGGKYRRAQCDGVRLLCHRIAWALHYGTWPDRFIDHINGDGFDNRICNLRLATRAQNGRNRGMNSNNTSGYKGVFWDKKSKKWFAGIMVNYKRIHLGFFATPEEANEAYVEAAKREHGEYFRSKP